MHVLITNRDVELTSGLEERVILLSTIIPTVRCYLMLLNNNYIATGTFSKILKICISKCKSFFKYPPFFISAGCNHDAKSNNNIIMNLLSKVKKDKGQNLEEMTVSNNIISYLFAKQKMAATRFWHFV